MSFAIAPSLFSMETQETVPTRKSLRPVTVLAGTILGVGVIMSPPPEGVSPEAWKVFGVALWMAFWWLLLWTRRMIPLPISAWNRVINVSAAVNSMYSTVFTGQPYRFRLV